MAGPTGLVGSLLAASAPGTKAALARLTSSKVTNASGVIDLTSSSICPTFFFGITFTQRDRVHKFGRRNVYAMILVAAVANVLAAVSLGTPMRYVVVGFIAILVSETVDTEIYQRLLHRPWLVRVASSNAVSAPVDSALFTILAFAGEGFATAAWMTQVILSDVAVKYGSSLVVALRLGRLRSTAPLPLR